MTTDQKTINSHRRLSEAVYGHTVTEQSLNIENKNDTQITISKIQREKGMNMFPPTHHPEPWLILHPTRMHISF